MAMNDFNSEDKTTRTIFARNISWNATVDDLFNIPAFKNASDIKIPTDRETGRPRGFGFIEFATPEECQQALQEAQNISVDGREMILAQSQPRIMQTGGRGGFRGGRGGGGFRGGRGGFQGQQQGGYQGGQQGGYQGQQQGGFQQGGYQGQQQGGYQGQQQQGGFQQGGQQQGGW